jgi:hypothetical protein
MKAYFLDAGICEYVETVVDYGETDAAITDTMYHCAIAIAENRSDAKKQFIQWSSAEWGIDLEWVDPISIRVLCPMLMERQIIDGWTEHHLWDLVHQRGLVRDL